MLHPAHGTLRCTCCSVRGRGRHGGWPHHRGVSRDSLQCELCLCCVLVSPRHVSLACPVFFLPTCSHRSTVGWPWQCCRVAVVLMFAEKNVRKIAYDSQRAQFGPTLPMAMPRPGSFALAKMAAWALRFPNLVADSSKCGGARCGFSRVKWLPHVLSVRRRTAPHSAATWTSQGAGPVPVLRL